MKFNVISRWCIGNLNTQHIYPNTKQTRQWYVAPPACSLYLWLNPCFSAFCFEKDLDTNLVFWEMIGLAHPDIFVTKFTAFWACVHKMKHMAKNTDQVVYKSTQMRWAVDPIFIKLNPGSDRVGYLDKYLNFITYTVHFLELVSKINL